MTDTKWTILKILRWSTDYFQDKGVSEPRASAEVLLAHVLGLSRLDLYLHYDQPLTPEELARYKALLVRRRQGEPVAYLTGHREFWSLDFLVTPATLIPRPETEVLVGAALEAAQEFINAGAGLKPVPAASSGDLSTGRAHTASPCGLEVGVGSGAIVVALARELPAWSWLALDLSRAALAVAVTNARRLGVAGRIQFLQANLLGSFRAWPRFGLLVANLPYVPRHEWEALPRDIKDFEPAPALLGGEDGLALIRPLARQAQAYLQEGGSLLLEVGAGQAQEVLGMLEATGAYDQLEVLADYQGVPRVVRGRRRPAA